MRFTSSVAFVLAVGFWAAYGSIISYYCITDGTIWVVNPNTTLFKSATASNNETDCNVTMTDDLSNITVAGCDKEIQIGFTLSSRNSSDAIGDGIIGGNAYTETYIILCEEIPDEGIRFTRGLYVDVIAETVVGTVTQPAPVTEQPVTPIFDVQTSIWDYADTQEVYTGVVSDQLRWKIIGPEEYDILPISCTAYSGNTVGGSPNVAIITSGCAEDSSLVSNFQLAESDQWSVYAWFYVFKFYNTDLLTLGCAVRTCTRGASECSISCNGRKKREDTYTVYAADDKNVKNYKESYVIAHLRVSLTAKASVTGYTFHCVLISLCLSSLSALAM